MNILRLLVVVCCWPVSLMADNTARFFEILQEQDALYQELNGQEVILVGAMGSIVGEDIYFVNEKIVGLIPVEFDSKRSATAKLADCSVAMMLGGPQEGLSKRADGCLFEVHAELVVKSGLLDGMYARSTSLSYMYLI